jgi:NMD protein affecting ribosome stability and mRNA decay
MEADRPVVWCPRCGVKRAQYPRGLCRACDVAAGSYVAPRHAPRLCRRCGRAARERLCLACAWAVRVPEAPEVAPVPIREVVVAGTVFVVVWDGTRR